MTNHTAELARAAATPRPTPRADRRAWASLVVVAAIWAIFRAGADPRRLLNPRGRSQIAEFFAASVRPRLDPDFVRLAISETGVTLGYALIATVLSVAFGLVGALVLTERTWAGLHETRPVAGRSHAAVRGLAAVPRSLHELVLGVLLVNVLGLDPLVAVLAIVIPFTAITAKVFAEVLDETPREAEWALRAAGAGRFQAISMTTLPTAFGDLMSYGFYRFECSIRSAAVLGIIGAGGLGFQIALSFRSLQYEEMWTMLWALIIVSGIADRLSALVRQRRSRLNVEISAEIAEPTEVHVSGSRKDPLLVTGSAVLAVSSIASWIWLELDVRTLWSSRTRREATQLADGLWPPQIGEGGVVGLIGDTFDTVALAVLALLLSWPLASFLAFSAARHSRPASGAAAGRNMARRFIGGALRFLMLVMRAVPPPVWAFLAVFMFRGGTWAGAVGLGIYTFGVLGRLEAEAVENTDLQGTRALEALGASGFTRFISATLPTLAPRFASLGLYRWEVAVRETVAVGVVGTSGLGRRLIEDTSKFNYDGVTATVLALIVVTLGADLVSAQIRRALR